MKTIFMTISRGSLIRNFFHTGVISKLLKAGLKVVVLTPHWNEPELFKEYKHKNLFFEPLDIFHKTRLRKLFIEFYKGAVYNETVRARYLYRISGARPSKRGYFLRMVFFAPLGFIPGIKKSIRFLSACINPQRIHDYLFEKHKPDLVFNTAAGGDGGVLKSAKRFNVRTVDMPKSWDTISKLLFDTQADYMIVWSDFMKQQVVKFQGYHPDRVFVTGAPQFDFYTRQEGLMSREEFCKAHRLDPTKKIILYSSAGANLTDEPAYVRLIRKCIEAGKLQDMNILIRPHLGYKDDVKRFLALSFLPGVFIDTTDKQNLQFKDKWDSSWEHIVNLYNSLYHADACINTASTLILDATACDTPVINPGFDPDPRADPLTWSVKRLYKSDYIKAVLQTGGVWFPQGEEEFLEMLKALLERGERKKEGTKKIIDQFLYKVDGKSAERIANKLIEIISNSPNSPNF